MQSGGACPPTRRRRERCRPNNVNVGGRCLADDVLLPGEAPDFKIATKTYIANNQDVCLPVSKMSHPSSRSPINLVGYYQNIEDNFPAVGFTDGSNINSRGVQVFFSFVRGHIGFYGNERADWLAKEATKLIDFIPMTVPKSFYKSVFKKHVISQWNNLYQISHNAKSTKEFFPSIHGRLKAIHFVHNFRITQFLTGHRNFKAYLKRFNLSRTNLCSCSSGEIQDVNQVIIFLL
ncbi:hypothetical protein AVEN_116671-1 [Araneus ventricosus]|uniref:RNase H type-1 domain-containing protein n=1 Tax=Araneus ventricosus TaxID=182803 RepID=A0A4Y2LVK9_ARAVE|nr:hypothetical protein AVEN_116671-1 [Araneus ventricosus]